MRRKLFCEWSPITYRISVEKEILRRKIINFFSSNRFSKMKSDEKLPITIYRHNSLIRRRLHNVDLTLQENKAISLGLAAPLVNGVLIRPDEVFSFWQLVGRCTKSKGYKMGLTISNNQTTSGIGGGMCQFTNLIHWMILHSPLDIVEHHHHNRFDLFPDVGRQIPFGTGTSICYNYLDYRFKNNTPYTFQLITTGTSKYLCGELRCDCQLPLKYHLHEKEAYFYVENGHYYRHNIIFRTAIDKQSGHEVLNEVLRENNALVMYDSSFIPEEKIRRNIN